MATKTVTLLLAVMVLAGTAPLVAQWANKRSPTISHQQRFPSTAPVVLSGQVVMEDGSPLGKLVQIDLVCNGRITQQTLTEPDGSFFLEVGSPRTEDWMDPSMGGSADGTMESSTKVASPTGSAKADEVPSMGQGRTTLVGCEVRAAPMPGLVSNLIPLRTRSTFDNPEIGKIILRKLSDAEATTVSLKTLSAPDDAQKSFKKATEALEKEKPNTGKAMKELEKAVKEYPEFSAAWDLLARVQMSRGDRESARTSFLRAVEIEPKFIQPYMGLAQMAAESSDWKETADWSGKVIELDSGFAPGLYWNGMAGFYLGDFEKGVASLSRLYELGYRDEYPFGLLPLGVMHANQGQIQSAAEAISLYLKIMPADRVSETQRSELEQQLAQWTASGRATNPPDVQSEQATP